MVRTYSANIIKSLLNAIDSNNVESISTYIDYTFMEPYIVTSDVVLRCNCKSIRDVIMKLPTYIDLKKWKIETSGGKFLTKDYKKYSQDFMGNTLYSKIIYTVDNVKYKALLRLLIELNDENITDEEKDEIIIGYADITINDKVYSIIKVSEFDNSDKWFVKDIYSEFKCEDIPYETMSSMMTSTKEFIQYNTEEKNPLF